MLVFRNAESEEMDGFGSDRGVLPVAREWLSIFLESPRNF